MVMGSLAAPGVNGQTGVTESQRLSFDVASIKQSSPILRPATPLGNDFELWLGPDNQVSSGPDWFASKRFDIDAKCDPPIGGDPRKLNFEKRKAYEAQMLLRLRALLTDRFNLKLRQDAKDAAVFDLVVAKGGPKFQDAAKQDADGQVRRGSRVSPGHIEVYRADMQIFARMLSEFAGRTVVDRTGLAGSYDLDLDWAPEAGQPEASGPSLFTAVQEQLGLRLQSAKESIPYFVVENASLPEPN
jgi:uncharacterized protein (TIGR03435 family)